MSDTQAALLHIRNFTPTEVIELRQFLAANPDIRLEQGRRKVADTGLVQIGLELLNVAGKDIAPKFLAGMLVAWCVRRWGSQQKTPEAINKTIEIYGPDGDVVSTVTLPEK